LGDEDSEYGLPLQLKSDINEPVFRSTVRETYEQIIHDLTQAAELLPDRTTIPTRPSKASAYAALAKLHLIVEDYEQAIVNAKNCLKSTHELMDYNTIDPDPNLPFKAFNPEVLFHGVTLATSGALVLSVAFVDSTLMEKYQDGDLRKTLFFRHEGNGHHRFIGSYEGTIYALLGGIALDEVYLIKSESEARMGMEKDAMETLNTLLVTRWKAGEFNPIDNIEGEQLLKLILEEREKQLLFRGGIRWSDLRRLNRDSRFAKTLKRKIGDVVYELPPNDLRYTFLLPFDVVEISDIKQNPR
jgi:tetratricopeptide (TPR) repeat protein